jgi:hypothetical protein
LSGELFLNFNVSNQKNYLFFTWLVKEILDEQIPEREGRSNPRVVKKPEPSFRLRSPYIREQE